MAFTALQGTLKKILKRHNIRDLEEVKIFSAWELIVGQKTARHTRPVRTADGILYIEVDDPLWLSQLKYMKPDILDRIEETIHKDIYKDIRFFLKNTV